MLTKRALTGLAAGCSMMLAGTTAAADEAGPELAIGGDLLFVLPVGNMADGTGVLLGPLVRFGYRVLPPLELTARTGYLFGFDKDLGDGIENRISDLPIWIGARYFFLDPDAGPYAGAEIGLNILHASTSVPDALLSSLAAASGATVNAPTSQTVVRFGFDISAGYVLSRKIPIDVRVQLNDFNLLGTNTDEKQLLGVGFSAEYTFRF